jgi:hypothetical protein
MPVQLPPVSLLAVLMLESRCWSKVRALRFAGGGLWCCRAR